MRSSEYFRTRTRFVDKQARQYLEGLLVVRGRGNISKYANKIPNSNNQSLNHFISDSPWNQIPINDNIQRDVVGLIGDEVNGSIHIDESGFPKQGKNSVGVKRQYCGQLGNVPDQRSGTPMKSSISWEVDNCQVGVFLAYTNGGYRTLIDADLYLPEDWAEDMKRRAACGVLKMLSSRRKPNSDWR